jgi:predicted amidohydrolase YtcJ
VVLFEGATLIDGNTGQPLRNSAFIMDGDRIGPVGRRGEVPLPHGATRVDLTGKVVIPALVSAHMHVGLLDGDQFGPQVYTRDKIVEHLQRYAYYGVGAVGEDADTGPLSADHPGSSRSRPDGARPRVLSQGCP